MKGTRQWCVNPNRQFHSISIKLRTSIMIPNKCNHKVTINCTSKVQHLYRQKFIFNRLTPNDHYSGRTAPLTSKRCILYIYSTNTGTEYFKHGIYCPFFPLQNAVCFIILTYLVPVLFTFYIQ